MVRIPAVKNILDIGFLLLIIKGMIGSSALIPYNDVVDTALSLAAAFCFAATVINRGMSEKNLFSSIALLLVALITSLNTGSLFVFLVVFTCIAAKERSVEKTIRFIYSYELILIVAHSILMIIMLFFGYDLQPGGANDTRYYFGFNHPNVFSMFLINITVMGIWLYYDRVKPWHLWLLLLIHFTLYLFTTCRTSVFVMTGLVMLYYLFYHKERRHKALSWLAGWGFPLCALLMFVLCSLYSSDIALVNMIDKLLASRVKLGAYALEHFGISFLGQNLLNVEVEWDSVWKLSGHTFDNIYSYLLVNYGVFWIILLSFMFYRYSRGNNERDNVAILLWIAYGITEVHPLNPYYFFPLLLLCTTPERRNPVAKLSQIRNDIRQ